MPANINPLLLQALRKHPLLQTLHQLGRTSHCAIYLVGGAVRDLLRGIPPVKDFDVVTADDPKHLARLFSRAVAGTFILWSETPPNYRIIVYRREERIEIDFAAFRGKDLEEDLLLRDFTVNAIAVSLNDLFDQEQPVFHDPNGGIADLKAGVLRITSERSFDDDPLRILRAIRIARMCHLSLHQDTIREILAKNQRLTEAAVERIRSEFFKAIEEPGARITVTLLEELGLLDILMPLPSPPFVEPEASSSRHRTASPPYHTIERCEWLLTHLDSFCAEFADAVTTHCAEEIEVDVHRFGLITIAGFLRDQVLHLRSDSANGNHDGSSAAELPLRLSDHFSACFKLGKKASRVLRVMADEQMRVTCLLNRRELSDRMCFRYFYDTGPEGIEAILFSLASASSWDAASQDQPINQNIRKSAHRLLYYYYAEYCIAHPRPLISGQDIMEEFGLAEGKRIGELLDRVGRMEAEGRISTRDEALAWIRSVLGTAGE